MNTGASWPSLEEAKARVLEIQTKLHQWSLADGERRFDDLYNLVCDPAFLLVGWNRVRSNRGARTGGVDGETARYIEQRRGTAVFLDDLRADLKARRFEPLPVRERMIPKTGGKLRRLGIPATRDRVVQASLKLVLEPIFEADFQPCSYGFRPRRRPHDAIAEIHMFATNSYEWVVEADIEACFDNISHSALMGRVRRRVGDKRVLGLIKAFLKAGILTEDGVTRDTNNSGTPQGGILSPLLAKLPCQSSTTISPRHGLKRWPPAGSGNADDATATRRIGLSDTPTILWCWWREPEPTPRASCGRRLWCWHRWALPCRQPRRGSSTSTRGSPSWGSASGGTRKTEPTNDTSTPTPRRRRSPPSNGK